MKFINALTTNNIRGENGMPTNSTSGSAVLDLFAMQGAGRNLIEKHLRDAFEKAYRENPLLALKSAFYNRDVREGQGERRSFRVFFQWLCANEPDAANANIPNVPFYGRWDDLFEAISTPVEEQALAFYASALLAGDALAAKWAPREGKPGANELRQMMDLNWKEYRKLLAGNSKTVEQLLCSRQWSEIDYNKLPSQAAYRYRKAFLKRDTARYNEYLQKLASGDATVKVNAGAVHPHEIARQFMFGRPAVPALLEAQWKALPNFLPEGKHFIPVSDVSGSMSGQPMEVSVALGIYLAERNVGPFKNLVITFSEEPSVIVLDDLDSLAKKVQTVSTADWGGSTNLEKTFRLILKKALDANLPQDAMPDSVLILSDMQFNQACSNSSDSAIQMIDRLYAQYGYRRPNVVFWNLRDSIGKPVKHDKTGTALVSGFSPSIMKTLLTGVDVPEVTPPTPTEVMLNTLESERYAQVVLE